MLTASINSLVSNQDGQEIKTSRTDARVTFKYSLPKGWFAFPELIFFSNNEINLNLRSVYKLGAGYYIFKTNKAYWGALGGLAYTIEDYKLPQPNRSSAEAFIGTDLNFYNIGDFNFALNANSYPSLTEKGRFRADLALDIKYDLPLDFYIKVGTTYNYDNQPGDGVSPSDYVFQTGFGYEF
ncbi:MAG: DUF481 domain-containing protein [Eudoraea sp.]|uniref:DUF481 domain-containing protein n=1 Tax=Eudoraea sp. TaxID=1979955 RepID=UPI003C78D91D